EVVEGRLSPARGRQPYGRGPDPSWRDQRFAVYRNISELRKRLEIRARCRGRYPATSASGEPAGAFVYPRRAPSLGSTDPGPARRQLGRSTRATGSRGLPASQGSDL